MMSFLSAVVTSRYPTTNNQLRNLSNPRQQATINDGRVTLQPVQGRQISFAMGTNRTYTPGASGSNSGKQRTICYNCKGEGHIGEEGLAGGGDPPLSKLCSAQANGSYSNMKKSLGIFGRDQVLQKEQDRYKQSLPTNPLIKRMIWMHITLIVMNSTLQKFLSWRIDLTMVQMFSLSTSGIRLIPESEETLMLAEESHFEKRFVPQTELSAEQAFWSQNSMNSSDPIDTQLNQENFQMDNSISNQSALNFDQYFELNELKAQSQEKDTVIRKLKERIKSLSGNMNEDKTYKQLYDSIKPTRIQSKEKCDALINQVNQKSVEISDLNVSLQEKDLVITALKDKLRKLKGKDLADNVVTKNTITLEMLKIDMELIAPRLLNNRTAHSDYLRYTHEQAAILKEIVEQGKSQNPLNNSLDSALVVTPKNKDKRVRFTKPVTSLGSTNIKIASSSNLVSNKPMLSSTRVKPSTSASGSQPSGNTKKDKIQQTPSSTQNNKVEAHSKTVKSSLKNKKCVVKPKGTANVQHSKLNANSELLYVKCKGCMLSDNHDLCVLHFINYVNARAKSKSRPTGRTFTIVGNACPLTRITITTKEPPRKPNALENDTPKPVVTLVYSRKPRKSKTNVPVSKPKIIKSISANNKEPSKSWGSIVSDVPSSSLNEC
ncbi:hypothetical protein Tco_0781653, partial [Tanacetum coccineum]